MAELIEVEQPWTIESGCDEEEWAHKRFTGCEAKVTRVEGGLALQVSTVVPTIFGPPGFDVVRSIEIPDAVLAALGYLRQPAGKGEG